MYAKKINNKIETYQKLPEELLIDDTWVKITEENARDYGFKEITMPEYNTLTHKRTLNIIENNGSFTYETVSLGKTIDELKTERIKELKEQAKQIVQELSFADVISKLPSEAKTKFLAVKKSIDDETDISKVASMELPYEDIEGYIKNAKDSQ